MECCKALLKVCFSESSLLQELHLCLQRHALLKRLLCRAAPVDQQTLTTPLRCNFPVQVS